MKTNTCNLTRATGGTNAMMYGVGVMPFIEVTQIGLIYEVLSEWGFDSV